jgi:hypothetical protein
VCSTDADFWSAGAVGLPSWTIPCPTFHCRQILGLGDSRRIDEARHYPLNFFWEFLGQTLHHAKPHPRILADLADLKARRADRPLEVGDLEVNHFIAP